MEQFEIQTQKTDQQIDYIICQSKNLRIKVIPPQRQPEEYGEVLMILTASFYARQKDGTVNTDIEITYDFEVIESVTGVPSDGWSMGLFFDAIDYYCEHALKRENDGISYTNNYKFYPYGGE